MPSSRETESRRGVLEVEIGGVDLPLEGGLEDLLEQAIREIEAILEEGEGALLGGRLRRARRVHCVRLVSRPGPVRTGSGRVAGA